MDNVWNQKSACFSQWKGQNFKLNKLQSQSKNGERKISSFGEFHCNGDAVLTLRGGNLNETKGKIYYPIPGNTAYLF